jgi:hypothetical protein
MNTKAILILAVLLAVVLHACELPIFPKEPAITFEKITPNRTGDTLVLTITFRDGDGDLGISTDDTLEAFNYYVEPLKKLNGEFVAAELPQFTPGVFSTFNGRFPVLKRDGQPGPIEGDLDYTIMLVDPPDFTNEKYIMPNDTVKFSVYIYDRALHKSNTVTSSEVVVLKR